MKQIIGIILIVSVFVGLFIYSAVSIGFKETLCDFGITLVITVVAVISVYLLSGV